jgi:hypothetical protein
VSSVWEDFEPGIRYVVGDFTVTFNKRVLEDLRRADPNGKHLRAIQLGRVGPRGQAGLVPSELRSYTIKTKVLGKGGAIRVHARILDDGTLYFERITRH